MLRSILAAMAVAGLAPAGATVEPSFVQGPWIPAWSAPYCTVSVGDAKDLALSIWQVPGSSGVEIYFAGPPAKVPNMGAPAVGPGESPFQIMSELSGAMEVQVDLGGGGRTIPATLLRTRPESTGVLGLGMNRDDFLANFASSNQLVMRQYRKSIAVAYAAPAQAMAQLRQCVDERLRQWGVDGAALDSLKRFPILRPGSWVRESDFPQDVMAKAAGTAVVVKVETNVSGRVTGCSVVLGSGFPALDDVTCPLAVSRARYKPAIGADGRPVGATFTNYVKF